MPAIIPRPRLWPADGAVRTTITPAARRAASVEAARARLRATARLADPIEVEAAARAYGTTVTLASLASIGGGLGAMAPSLWRRVRALGAGWTGAGRADP